MYLYRKRDELPLIAEGSTVRSPADPVLARRFACAHSDEDLHVMYEEAEQEFHTARRRASRLFGPLGLLCSMLSLFCVLGVGVAIMPKDGSAVWFMFIGVMLSGGYVAAVVANTFRRVEERRSQEPLVRAHSLRMAITLRKMDRWWKAYEAAGRPPLALP